MDGIGLDDLKQDHELRVLLQRPEVRQLMALRCEDQGHDYENCCTMFLQVYQACKWCGDRR